LDPAKKIRALADGYVSKPNRSGLSIGVTIRGKNYFYNGGLLDQSRRLRPTTKTIFEIGSITKTFTGVLLAQAVEDKKLNLQDDIRKYLPGDYPNLAFEGHPIRVIDLANQTSGLPQNSTVIPSNSSPSDIVRLEKANNDVTFLSNLHSVRLDHAPGEKLEYSNTGFGLLGIVLERVYGLTFEALVTRLISKPLAMPDTGITLSPSQLGRFAPGTSSDGSERPSLILGVPASGGLRSTVSDLMRYVRANVTANHGPMFVSHLLTAGSESGGVGLGWDVDKDHTGAPRFSHDGGMLGYSAYVAVIPGRSFGIVILTNQSGVLGDLRGLGEAITKALAGE